MARKPLHFGGIDAGPAGLFSNHVGDLNISVPAVVAARRPRRYVYAPFLAGARGFVPAAC
jgi:hypothetical protein